MKKSFLSMSIVLLCTIGFATAAVPDQPHMEAAKVALAAAKAELQHAEHNKGGHRANALGFVNSAIIAVNHGIQYGRTHPQSFAAEFLVGTTVTPDQPHMQAALTNLQKAKAELDAATPDKGGYRKAAIDFVNQAIDEVNKGIAAGM